MCIYTDRCRGFARVDIRSGCHYASHRDTRDPSICTLSKIRSSIESCQKGIEVHCSLRNFKFLNHLQRRPRNFTFIQAKINRKKNIAVRHGCVLLNISKVPSARKIWLDIQNRGSPELNTVRYRCCGSRKRMCGRKVTFIDPVIKPVLIVYIISILTIVSVLQVQWAGLYGRWNIGGQTFGSPYAFSQA